MNNIRTNKGTQANKIISQNRLGFSLLTATLFALFSSSAFANRPAMENRSDVTNAVVEAASDSRPDIRPESLPEDQQEAPSAVEIMMQQQNRQTTGDVIQLPAKEMQPGETLKIQLLDYPRRGMSMEKVQHEYGQPIAISESVGKPPITHWTYSDRVVYFEYSTVLHVVAR